MAIGKASDFVIRSALFDAFFVESFRQNLSVFNEASRGALSMSAKDITGDYGKLRFTDRINTLHSRRDTTSVAAQTATALTQDEIISVKLNRKFNVVEQTVDAMRKVGMTNDEVNAAMAELFAEGQIAQAVEASIIALKNAVGQDSNTVFDYSGTGTMVHTALIDGLTLFGDKASKLVTWLGHSTPRFALMKASLSVSSGTVGEATIYNADVGTINRPYVETDSSNFIITGTPNDYVTFGLVPGAVEIEFSEARDFVSYLATGNENLSTRWQGEYAFNLTVKGHQWDITNGGANPTDATLGTAGNWDRVVGGLKDGPGIYVRTQ